MLLVDAYNVLHTTGILPPEVAGIDIRGLAALVGSSRWRTSACRLICDGTGESGVGKIRPDALPRGVSVDYAGPGRDADSLIERLIKEHTAPKRLLVVSSDRRLRSAARRRRCKWLSSEQFLAALAQDASTAGHRRHPSGSPPQSPVDADVENWLREFGFDPGRPTGPRSSPEPDPPATTPERPQPAPPPIDDDLRREIAREWSGRVDPDDLDMERWIDPEPPVSRPPPDA